MILIPLPTCLFCRTPIPEDGDVGDPVMVHIDRVPASTALGLGTFQYPLYYVILFFCSRRSSVVVTVPDCRLGDPGSIPTQCYDSLGKWMYLRPGQPIPCEGNWVPSLWYNSMGRLCGDSIHKVLHLWERMFSCVILVSLLYIIDSWTCIVNTESAVSGYRCESYPGIESILFSLSYFSMIPTWQ